MNHPRLKKATAALLPGCVLAEPVCDPAGKMLLPAGATLSESVIASLVRRQIAEVVVVDADPAAVAAARDARRARLDYLFRNAGDNIAAQTLFNAVLAYRQCHQK